MKRFFLMGLLVVSFVIAGQSGVYAEHNLISDAGVTTGSSIVAPYWQAGRDDNYTFIAITNNSISSNQSRAVTIQALHRDGSTRGSATTLTIRPSHTARVFIMATGSTDGTMNATYSIANGENLISITSNNGGGSVVINTTYGNFASFLSVWGAIYFPANQSGFAMEFVGDASDSQGITGSAASAGDL